MSEINKELMRAMPSDSSVEWSVLCCMMLDPENAIDAVRAKGSERSFYAANHRIIFNAIIAIQASGKVPDIILLTSYLREHGNLDRVGGPAVIGDLLNDLPNVTMLDWYLEKLRNHHILRDVITTASGFASQAYEFVESPMTLLGEIEAKFQDVSNHHIGRVDGRTQDWRTIATESVARMERLREQGDEVGISTGFPLMDEAIGLMRAGEMIMLAGPTGGGKTALAMNAIAANVADAGHNVLAIQSEMSNAEVADRFIANKSGVSLSRIRQPKNMLKVHFDKVAAAIQRTINWNLSIDDTPRVSVLDIPAICRRTETKTGKKLDLIVVDYLQRLKHANENEPFERQVSNSSVLMKSLARQFDCPVIVLSQLNADGRLRSSRDAENEADDIWIIEPNQEDLDNEKPTRRITLKRTKGRSCGTGDLHFEFDGPFMRYREVERPSFE